jgi:UDP-sugar transporter A1/2/3
VLYLVLLALNYAVMPRLAGRYVHPKTNGKSIALAEEIVKMGLGAAGWVVSSGGLSAPPPSDGASSSSSSSSSLFSPSVSLSDQLREWSPYTALIGAGIPSALYALQGTLTYASYRNLDAVTYNGLSQLKVMSSALCCYLVLGKGQSMMQMASLGLLTMGAAVFRGGSWEDWKDAIVVVASRRGRRRGRRKSGGAVGGRGGTAAVAKGGDDENDDDEDRGNRRFLFGVLPCLAATMLSGLAGALSQGSLQTTRTGVAASSGVTTTTTKTTTTHHHHRNAYLYTVEISFLSATCLVLSMGVEWFRDRRRAAAAAAAASGTPFERTTAMPASSVTTTTTTTTATGGFFRHWTYATLIPVVTKAAAGLLTALVHRHLGSVIKGFALVLGLVFSALLQFALEGADLTPGQLVGTALVLLSSWLHFTNPP